MPRPGTVQRYVEAFTIRVIAEALAEAQPAYWRRRGSQFRPGSEAAVACERHAQLLESEPVADPELVAEVEAVVRAVVQVRAAASEAA